jgi:cytochrome c oxidase cbb3-type subunit 3
MAEQRYDELTDHNYDGIQEYDNPTPGWWHLIFWGTIVWSAVYVVVMHLTPMIPSREERLASVEQAAIEAQFSELMQIEDPIVKVRTIMGDQNWLDQGQAVYKGICVQCHGQNGEGLIGPNLTDNHYKNLTDLEGMLDVLHNGAANGAMPAQKGILNENEIALVVGYVASLRGQMLDGPRGVEGEEIAPFPEPITEESGG